MEDSKRENDELRKLVLELQNKFETLEQSNQTFRQNLKNTLKQELTKEFEGIINGIRTDMNNAISSIKTEFESSIKQYENNAMERERRMNDQNISSFRIVAGELLQKSIKTSPSEDNGTALVLRGGGQ